MTVEYSSLRGFKYRVLEEFSVQTEIKPEKDIISDFSSLDTTGKLTIQKGFCWDGATGAIDTDTIMRGSCVHDALTCFFSKGLLTLEQRKQADLLFKQIIIDDGASEWRAGYLYGAIKTYVGLRYDNEFS